MVERAEWRLLGDNSSENNGKGQPVAQVAAAKELEGALMLVQELNHTRWEAVLCARLSQLYLDGGMGSSVEAAIVYSQQSLSTYRQLRDVGGMCRAYEALNSAYSTVAGCEEEAAECQERFMSLARITKRRK